MKKRICISLLATLVGCGALRAQSVISYVASIPQSSADWSKTIGLQGFDSTLGTLTQVQLIYSEQTWQSIFAENLSGMKSAFDLTSNATVGWTAAGATMPFYALTTGVHQVGTLGSFDGTIDYSGLSGINFGSTGSTSGSMFDSDLARYLTNGLVDFTATVVGTSALTGGGNLLMGATTSAAASLEVKYTYTPIPEPSSYAALLGVITLGLVMGRRFWIRPRLGVSANG
jgi:hypothetical protein